MSVSNNITRFPSTGDGVKTVYSMTNCLVYDSAHVLVYLAGALQGSGYVVSGIADAAGAVVTFTVAPANGVAVLLLRVVPFTQLSVYGVSGAFPAKTTEKNLDLVCMEAQQLNEVDARALKVPVASVYTGTVDIPDPAVVGNQGKFMQITATGIAAVTPATGAGLTDPMTAKGDLVTKDATPIAVRLPVGTDGQTLEADSTVSQGLGWRQGLRKLVTTLGDILVATASGTLARLGAGVNGRVLRANSNASTGLEYGKHALGQTFRGLQLRNHPDSDSVNTKLMLVHADEIVLDNGESVSPADRLVLDKAITGAGGMQAAAVNSTWNKAFYIRKRIDGTEALFGLRAKDYLLDQDQNTSDANQILRQTSTNSVKLAQGVQVATTGKCEFVDIQGGRLGSPVGNIWFTIETDSSGNPSGSVLATSDKYDVARIMTAGMFRIPFRSPATLTVGTQYHLVLQGDYAFSAVNTLQWSYKNTTNPYANGSAKQFDGTTWTAVGTTADFRFRLYITENDTALSMPAGYDQSCQIGWFYIDGSGIIKATYSLDRLYTTASVTADKRIITGLGTAITLIDLSSHIPPVMCMVRISGGNTTVVAGFSVGHIRATDANPNAYSRDSKYGSMLLVSTGPALGVLADLLLEYQACAAITASGTCDLILEDFLW